MNDLEFHPRPENKNVSAFGLVWSGSFVPQIGDVVATYQHGLLEVIGFFTEDGYLGVECRPLEAPAWFVRQCGEGATAYLFGAEIRPVKGPNDLDQKDLDQVERDAAYRQKWAAIYDRDQQDLY